MRPSSKANGHVMYICRYIDHLDKLIDIQMLMILHVTPKLGLLIDIQTNQPLICSDFTSIVQEHSSNSRDFLLRALAIRQVI